MARLKGFQKLVSVDEALKTFQDAVHIPTPKTTVLGLDSALNRILAEDIIAENSLPRFDRSAVDGYAVKAEDTTGASQFKPAKLRLVENERILPKQARQVWTGNPIPKGADAVVMMENVGLGKEGIEVQVPLTKWENVSRKGEDVQKGEEALNAGIRLRPHHLGLMAALGKADAKVFERPKVAVLATGNELAETGTKLRESQIFDSNRLIISSQCRELNAEPFDLGIARDDADEIAEKLKTGIQRADLIITTGGTSVGVADLVPDATNKIGKPGVIVHGVAMRPGMPTALAIAAGKPIIMLSGNPVAAVVGFEIFARPLLCRMLGLRKVEQRPVVNAKTTRRVATALGRRSYVRVRVLASKGELLASPISSKGSSVISTMTRANGYVVVPENREGLEEGEIVQVQLFSDVEAADGNV